MSVAILVDGSNMMYENGRPSLDRLRGVVAALRMECTSSGRSDVEVVVFVDASTRHSMTAADRSMFDRDLLEGAYFMTPAGVEADAFILSEAEHRNAIILSNDLFRDYRARYSWIAGQDSGRFVTAHRSTGPWLFVERTTGTNKGRQLRELLQSSVRPSQGRYRAEITRRSPHAMVLLVDQSSSMANLWSGGGAKHLETARILNRLIGDIVIACTRAEGVRDYVFLAALGYGGDGAGQVRALLPGTTPNSPFMSVSRVNDAVRFGSASSVSGSRPNPYWIEPAASGKTPMCAALRTARTALDSWVREHRESFPPVVLNISDGASTDGSPVEVSREICRLRTDDGEALVFNCCISSSEAPVGNLRYSANISDRVVGHAQEMFNASSVIPDSMKTRATAMGVSIPLGGRGFLYNASIEDFVGMLNFGTPEYSANR